MIMISWRFSPPLQKMCPLQKKQIVFENPLVGFWVRRWCVDHSKLLTLPTLQVTNQIQAHAGTSAVRSGWGILRVYVPAAVAEF